MRRFKFSLSAILLVVAVVGVIVSTVLNNAHVAKMQQQQRELIEQTGYIDVDDPALVYVRELFCPAPETWQFQVYTPKDHELMAGIGTGLRDDEDYPTQLLMETYFRRNGQTTITISVFKDRQGRWRVSHYYPHNGSNVIVQQGDFSWLLERDSRINGGSTGTPLHGSVRAYRPDQRIPLLVLRNEEHNADSPGGQPSGSLMIWLEPNLQPNFRARQEKADSNPSDAQ